jgi:hypothetical protein
MKAPDWYIDHPLSVVAANDEPCDLVTMMLNQHARHGHDHEAARLMDRFVVDGFCEAGNHNGRRAWWMTAEQRQRWIDECRAIRRETDGPDPEPHRLNVPQHKPRASGWKTFDTVEQIETLEEERERRARELWEQTGLEA